MDKSRDLRIISLEPSVVLIKENREPKSSFVVVEEEEEEEEENLMVAAVLVDPEQTIADISELVDIVYEKFSEACDKRKLKWEAELELGLQFGVKFSAKLKISPTTIATSTNTPIPNA